MSHKHDDLDTSISNSDGMHPLANNWMLGAAANDLADSSPQEFDNEFAGGGSDSFGNFRQAFAFGSVGQRRLKVRRRPLRSLPP